MMNKTKNDLPAKTQTEMVQLLNARLSDAIDLELQTGKLAILDVIGTPVMRHWHVAHLAKKRLSPTAVAFKQFVLTEGRELMRTQKPHERERAGGA